MIRMGIRNKLLLATLGIVAPTLLLTVAVMIGRFERQSQDDAERIGVSQVDILGGQLSELLNTTMGNVHTLSALVNGVDIGHAGTRLPVLDSALRWLLGENPNITGTWVVLDKRNLTPESLLQDGEVALHYGWDTAGGVRRDTTLLSAGFANSDEYAQYRERNRDACLDPYPALASESGDYMISICAPLRDRVQQSIGLVGVEVSLSVFSPILSASRPYASSYALLLSPSMRIMGATETVPLGKGLGDAALRIPDMNKLLKPLRLGQRLHTSYKNSLTDETSYLFSAPIRVGNDSERVNLLYIIPRNALQGYTDRTITLGYIVAGIGLVILVLLLVWIANRIGNNLRRASRSLLGLSEGRIDSRLALDLNTQDELGAISTATNRLLLSMEKKVEFAEAIGAGNMETEYEGGEEDVLGKSLKRMQESLRKAEERDRRQRTFEKQQAWATEKLAEFSEVLRFDAQDLKSFAYHIIHHLAQYAKAEIGALYIRKTEGDEEEYYTLEAAYAYEVRKYVTAKIYPREGLVGRCVAERSRIYLTDVPEDYVRIASGLGAHKPDSLLLVPAMMNESMEAVIELARFGGFDEHVIRFIESVAGSLAATLVTVQNHLQNQSLLEEAKRQGRELEEKKRTLEEMEREVQQARLQAIQQEAEFHSLQSAIRNSCCVVEYALDGEVLFANTEYLNTLGLSHEEVVGHRHFDNLVLSNAQAAEYHKFWSELQAGQTKRNILSRIESNGKMHVFLETYSPLLLDREEVYRIIKIAVNITEYAGDEEVLGFDFSHSHKL